MGIDEKEDGMAEWCEAAAEDDHLWQTGADGVERCRECGMEAGK
jgi:hypothetical protein